MRRAVLSLAWLFMALRVLGITSPNLASAAPPLHQIASTSTGSIADVNGDGIVDLFDLVIIATAYNPTGPVLGFSVGRKRRCRGPKVCPGIGQSGAVGSQGKLDRSATCGIEWGAMRAYVTIHEAILWYLCKMVL